MKEKIMNIKNVLKIILMIFIIFSMIKSCSNAASNPTLHLIELNNNVNKEEIFDNIYEHYFNVNINNLNSTQLTNFNNYKNYWVQEEFSGICYQYSKLASTSSAYQLTFMSVNDSTKIWADNSQMPSLNNVYFSQCKQGILYKPTLSFNNFNYTRNSLFSNFKCL